MSPFEKLFLASIIIDIAYMALWAVPRDRAQIRHMRDVRVFADERHQWLTDRREMNALLVEQIKTIHELQERVPKP